MTGGANPLSMGLVRSAESTDDHGRGIPGNSNTARWLLGREPTSWEGLIRRELQLS